MEIARLTECSPWSGWEHLKRCKLKPVSAIPLAAFMNETSGPIWSPDEMTYDARVAMTFGRKWELVIAAYDPPDCPWLVVFSDDYAMAAFGAN